jgi:hypothetical protein
MWIHETVNIYSVNRKFPVAKALIKQVNLPSLPQDTTEMHSGLLKGLFNWYVKNCLLSLQRNSIFSFFFCHGSKSAHKSHKFVPSKISTNGNIVLGLITVIASFFQVEHQMT